MGTPVVALCGKVWVPSRAPEKFPVCPECKEIWETLKPGEDDGDPAPSDRAALHRLDEAVPTVSRPHPGLAGPGGLGHGHRRCAPGRPPR